jgi:hypothetical protein
MKVIDMLMCFSISRLMQAVGKLICGWQEERVIKTYVQKLKFNILQEMKYEAICVAINLTCQWSAAIGSSFFNFSNIFFN